MSRPIVLIGFIWLYVHGIKRTSLPISRRAVRELNESPRGRVLAISLRSREQTLHDPEHEKRVITLKNVLDSFDSGLHPEAQHTEYYNDLDMMVMGVHGMNNAMDRIHMGLWVISSAPLMVGSDLTRLSPATLSLLKDKEAVAIHNDAYGLQPIKVAEPTAGVQVWAKPMAVAGRRAVAILNRTETSAQVKIDWSNLGLVGTPRLLRDHGGPTIELSRRN